MQREHRLWRSPNLGWDMGVAVFGHFGPPVLFLPTSLGDELEHEGQGMIRTLSPLIRSTAAGCSAATTPTSGTK